MRQVAKLRESQTGKLAKVSSTRERLDALAAIQQERAKQQQTLRDTKDRLVRLLSKPAFKGYVRAV
jgi:hypothetical protein